MKKLSIILINLVILGGAIYLGYSKYEEYFNNPWTRDGQVRANVIKVAPRVSGPITQVSIKDNQFVHQGDLLFAIDPSTYQVALDQSKVSVEQAKNNAYGKKVEFERVQEMRDRDKGSVSHKDLIRKEIAYKQSLLQIKSAEEQLKSAELNLQFTKVYASVDGYVSNVDIRTGTQAVANQPLLALVDINSFWVFGYFRENQLESIQPGADATVTLMAHPDTPLKAHVESIGWGIAPKDGTVGYNLLPNVNPVFQWIRLAQRIPVKVVIDELPENIHLRFGLTASIMVHQEDESSTQQATSN
ncbi:HlyD family secretion protein [Vibrio rumoiensis]|uniref:Efflux transporter periplasmic adaptor subunit n=1 Tax=Vibrio rumoiensis 1S-45 TaxID=1188252 RepID=A0A1E5E5H8_9VIBR|nr:HlyD family secretion protein [Vibrio rumoiensis]OEF28658.1 efflux transporter periplasmic adaptor subunit [Vibrio rumoiensis 1S-45]